MDLLDSGYSRPAQQVTAARRRFPRWCRVLVFAACASSFFSATLGETAPYDTVERLPQIVSDPPNKQVDVQSGFVINIKSIFVSPRLRARIFKGSLSDLRSSLGIGELQDGCIVYDSLVVSSQWPDSSLRFDGLDPTWLARDYRSDVFVIVFEIGKDGDTPVGPVKLHFHWVGEYFLNGYQIFIPRPPGLGTPTTKTTRIDSRDSGVRTKAKSLKCIEKVISPR